MTVKIITDSSQYSEILLPIDETLNEFLFARTFFYKKKNQHLINKLKIDYWYSATVTSLFDCLVAIAHLTLFSRIKKKKIIFSYFKNRVVYLCNVESGRVLKRWASYSEEYFVCVQMKYNICILSKAKDYKKTYIKINYNLYLCHRWQRADVKENISDTILLQN